MPPSTEEPKNINGGGGGGGFCMILSWCKISHELVGGLDANLLGA